MEKNTSIVTNLFRRGSRTAATYTYNASMELDPVLYPVSGKVCTNKALCDILCPPSDESRYPSDSFLRVEDILARVQQFFDYLSARPVDDIPAGVPCIMCPSITRRQIFCTYAVRKLLGEGRFFDALHELHDCVDNFGEVNINVRPITPNEHALYSTLAAMFIYVLKNTVINGKNNK